MCAPALPPQVFLQEFVDARKKVQSAPQVIYSWKVCHGAIAIAYGVIAVGYGVIAIGYDVIAIGYGAISITKCLGDIILAWGLFGWPSLAT